MSNISLRILPRLTSFWPETHDDEELDTPTDTVVDNPPSVETLTEGGITVLPVEIVPRFYRYVKGTATSDSGKTYDYTARFISDPAADDDTQQGESIECQAIVQAELERWLASAAALPELAIDPAFEEKP